MAAAEEKDAAKRGEPWGAVGYGGLEGGGGSARLGTNGGSGWVLVFYWEEDGEEGNRRRDL